jgi:hypothetical protein
MVRRKLREGNIGTYINDYMSANELWRALRDVAMHMEDDGITDYVEDIIHLSECAKRLDNKMRDAARDLGLYNL